MGMTRGVVQLLLRGLGGRIGLTKSCLRVSFVVLWSNVGTVSWHLSKSLHYHDLLV